MIHSLRYPVHIHVHVPLAGASFLGWTLPSSIPVSAFGGQSLFGLLNASIAEELAHFPVGPALTDKFWLYLLVGGCLMIEGAVCMLLCVC